MKKHKILIAIALLYLSVMILLPISTVFMNAFKQGILTFLRQLTEPLALHALKLTFVAAITVGLINAIMGTMTAIVLTRYSFKGSGILNSLIDMPFAIPTLVTGVMLVAFYGPQEFLGKLLKDYFGLDIVFAVPGIILALLFITFPFVVRTVEPLLMELDKDEEEAALTLGASGWTTFWRILFPTLLPGILSGSLLAIARSIGEFGAVVLVAGNIPLKTQTASVYVFGEFEAGNFGAASSMAVALILFSFFLKLAVERLKIGQVKL